MFDGVCIMSSTEQNEMPLAINFIADFWHETNITFISMHKLNPDAISWNETKWNNNKKYTWLFYNRAHYSCLTHFIICCVIKSVYE